MSDVDALREGLNKIAETGVMQLHIVRLPDAWELVRAARLGDFMAAGLVGAVNHFMDTADMRARGIAGPPVLCLCCEAGIAPPFGPDIAVCIVVPDVETPTASVGMGICERCAQGDDLKFRVAASLEMVWPGVRAIRISSQAGHA